MTKDTSQITIFATVKRAEEIAEANNRDDPDWTYEVGTCEEGAFIEVYDENRVFMGWL